MDPLIISKLNEAQRRGTQTSRNTNILMSLTPNANQLSSTLLSYHFKFLLVQVRYKQYDSYVVSMGLGSGKTHVLTCRVAFLILDHGIAPSSICCLTFTNKAASEMRHRLKTLVGNEKCAALKMGTFHALCARFLRSHGERIDVKTNFAVCDADQS